MLSKVSFPTNLTKPLKPLFTITVSENVFHKLYNNVVNCTIIFHIQPFPFLFFAIFGNSSPPTKDFQDGRNVFKPTRINQVGFPNFNMNCIVVVWVFKIVVWAEFISLQICIRGIGGELPYYVIARNARNVLRVL